MLWPGVSTPSYTAEQLAALDAKNVEYNGKLYSQYEISQMRRGLERRERAAKRRYLAEDAAGLDTGRAAAQLKNARQKLSKFVADTSGKVDEARTSVPGFGFAEGKAAEKAAEIADRQAAEKQFRKKHNTGIYSTLEERMSLQNVRQIVKDMEIDLKGVKLSIIRSKELLDRPEYMGYTFPDGSAIQLYPAAFANKEQLVKTIGHEYTHLKQTRERGIVKTTEELAAREREAYGTENQWWENYRKKTGIGK